MKSRISRFFAAAILLIGTQLLAQEKSREITPSSHSDHSEGPLSKRET
jgi:hypothetical protein